MYTRACPTGYSLGCNDTRKRNAGDFSLSKNRRLPSARSARSSNVAHVRAREKLVGDLIAIDAVAAISRNLR